MLLLIVSTFWHLKLGLQVVVEDYVHDEGSKFFWIVLVNFASVVRAAPWPCSRCSRSRSGSPA